ncbi:23S rRNA (guanosine(2251)-2'-O)-methyltransferase RlmB [Thioalkalicoccus limnaeus]|uniref:23S rRNA (guanosine-2'-O-)-methyltransferase RlmB n=1 Tax=Thioalkalicoccus limnaeus TaxID=120681 RepID=A0ABV4BBG6_9GAMM
MTPPGLTPIGGRHSVRLALKQGQAGLVELWIAAGDRERRLADLAEQARQAGLPVRVMAREELDRVSPGLQHQGVLAWVRPVAPRDETDLETRLEALSGPPFLLILDEVQDPHNLGACLRTAEAVGVQAVIAPRDRAVGLTPVVLKVACGATETLPYIQVANLSRTMDRLKARGIWLVGLTGDAGADLYDADLTGPLALVMGNEGRGLRRLTRERCDLLVRLPMVGQVESLNVSVATGIGLYEAFRQRRPV